MANKANEERLYEQLQKSRLVLEAEAKKIEDLARTLGSGRLYRQSKIIYERLLLLSSRIYWVQKPNENKTPSK